MGARCRLWYSQDCTRACRAMHLSCIARVGGDGWGRGCRQGHYSPARAFCYGMCSGQEGGNHCQQPLAATANPARCQPRSWGPKATNPYVLMRGGIRSSALSSCSWGCAVALGTPPPQGEPYTRLLCRLKVSHCWSGATGGLTGCLSPQRPAPAPAPHQVHAGNCPALPWQRAPPPLNRKARHPRHIPEKGLHPTSRGVTSKLGTQATGWRRPRLTSASILSDADSCRGVTDRLCFFSVFCILFHIQLSGRGIRWP